MLTQAGMKRMERAKAVLSISLLAGCLGSCLVASKEERIPAVEDPLPAAIQATRNEQWARAAHYWKKVFLLSENKDSAACVEGARAMLNLGHPEAASDLLQLGLRENPHDIEMLVLKGDALVALGFRRSAEICYELCLQQEPNRIPILCALGKLRLSLDREASAVEPLQRALDLGCEDMETREQLARAYRDSGEPLRAWSLFVNRVSLEPPPSPEFVIEAAGLAMNPALLQERPDAVAVALVWLECSLQLHPNHTGAHFQHGVLSEALLNSDDAIHSYRRALETQPMYLPALTHLALLFAERDDEGLCREMVERALTLESSRERRAALRNLLAKFE